MKFIKNWIAALLIGLIICVLVSPSGATDYTSEKHYGEQQLTDQDLNSLARGPGLPPANWTFNATPSDYNAFRDGTGGTITDVPTLWWSYGCSLTSASMLFGYYDRNGYPNMYVGPTNNGEFPLTSVWGHQTIQPKNSNGENPLGASHNGLDGRTTRGHVDDYYFASSEKIDPYNYTSHWTPHADDSVGDYMGTSQYWKWNNPDGSTKFYMPSDNSPAYDFTLYESFKIRDGAHGMKLFAESRGYTVTTTYNQNIAGYKGNPAGFTYEQYKKEIDDDHPVLIQLYTQGVGGHTMLGVGYSGTNQILVHDTWDLTEHPMTWGGSYGGMAHDSVTVFHLAPNGGGTTPTVTSITPASGANTGSVSITDLAGTNFANGAIVHLTRSGSANISATGVVVVSPTRITCTLPLSGTTAGQYNVVVRNLNGKEGVLSNGFTITSPGGSVPTITSITPSSGANTGSVSITDLAGTNFANGAIVHLTRSGSANISATGITVVSPTRITCTLPLSGTTAGQYNVVVRNLNGKEGVLSNGFTITSPDSPLTVTSITPSSGANTGSVSITNLAGTNFANGATVRLSGTSTGGGNPVHYRSIRDGDGGALLNYPEGLFVSGNYAYVTSSSSHALEIVDISNPSNPVHKGSLTNGTGGALLSNPGSIYVSGNYAYITDFSQDALEIVDVSNPANPVHKGSIRGSLFTNTDLLWPVEVSVSGNYAYIACGGSNALEIVDISNPANPVHKGSISDGAGGALLDYPNGVFISGNYAYVTSARSDALEIVDVSNPANPVHKGSITDGAGGALLDGPCNVFISGNYAYVATFDSNALEIVDVSDPTNPTHKGSISNGYGGALLDYPKSVFVSGNYAYVASSWSDALEIVDISNPANPVHKGSITDGAGGALLDNPCVVLISGNYAYVTSSGSDALEIIELTGGSSPVNVYATGVSVVSPNKITCTLPLIGVPTGWYNVVVTNPGGKQGTLMNGFRVTDTGLGTGTKIGIYNGGNWYMDYNADGQFIPATGDRYIPYGASGWTQLVGDWNGDGTSEIGIYKDGLWYIDYGGSGVIDANTRYFSFGGAGWTPIVGDWNADARDEIGVYNAGNWYLDYDGSGGWSSGDRNYGFGATGWMPVTGKWTNDGYTKIGIYNGGNWYIDYNGDGQFIPATGDRYIPYGASGWTQLVGDWNGDGTSEIGIFKDGLWYIDYGGSGVIDANTRYYSFGGAGWTPIVADWNADNKDEIGVYQNGNWYFDNTGNGAWDAGDLNYGFGTAGWTPVIGKW